jgi:signal transduction histidine kinase
VSGLAAGVTVADGTADIAAGLALLAAGALTWRRARRSGTGPLLALTGITWLAGDVSSALVHAHRGPLVHVLLSYPDGRVRSAPVAVVIGAAYVDGLVPTVARSPWVTIALMAAVVCAAAWRWITARGVEKRARAVPLACAAAIGGALGLAAIGRLAGADTDAIATWAYDAAIALTAVVLAADLLSGRSARAAATGLVVDLAASQKPQALRAALARTVGDPALEIAFRAGEGWVDEAGQPVRLPGQHETDRGVTVVEDRDRPIAALVHDSASLRDEALARSVAAAVRLVVANVRLQTDVAARVRDVAASRRRLVEAGDEQRRRLREELQAGAEQRLREAAGELAALAAPGRGEAAATVAELEAELDAARIDLARFAQGVHPRALTEHGLAAALGELAEQAAVRVVMRVPARRCPGPQEAAAFFLCSEALANVAKYAGASVVRIDVESDASRLVVRVADDGRGGADPARGSGLRGLADRVEALGGMLSVTSPIGSGTLLEAELPIGVPTWV